MERTVKEKPKKGFGVGFTMGGMGGRKSEFRKASPVLLDSGRRLILLGPNSIAGRRHTGSGLRDVDVPLLVGGPKIAVSGCPPPFSQALIAPSV